MSNENFNNAKEKYQTEKAAYLAALQNIDNSLNEKQKKNPILTGKIERAKQLYVFCEEQARYFDLFVKKRSDAAQFVKSVYNVLELATTVLKDVKEAARENSVPFNWTPYYDNQLVDLVNKAPGAPNRLKGGLKIALATIIPGLIVFVAGFFLAPINPIFLILLIVGPLSLAFFCYSDMGKRILGNDFKPQPGSLSEQINYLRTPPDHQLKYPYHPTGSPGRPFGQEFLDSLAPEASYQHLFQEEEKKKGSGESQDLKQPSSTASKGSSKSVEGSKLQDKKYNYKDFDDVMEKLKRAFNDKNVEISEASRKVVTTPPHWRMDSLIRIEVQKRYCTSDNNYDKLFEELGEQKNKGVEINTLGTGAITEAFCCDINLDRDTIDNNLAILEKYLPNFSQSGLKTTIDSTPSIHQPG